MGKGDARSGVHFLYGDKASAGVSLSCKPVKLGGTPADDDALELTAALTNLHFHVLLASVFQEVE